MVHQVAGKIKENRDSKVRAWGLNSSIKKREQKEKGGKKRRRTKVIHELHKKTCSNFKLLSNKKTPILLTWMQEKNVLPYC